MASIYRIFAPVYAVAGVLGTGCFGSTALAQQFAFSESDASDVEYWLTPYESQTTCADLLAMSGFEFSLISAVERTVSGTSIEFCKVDGVIQPAIQFQVDLPSNWNGRIYMHGNGGNGGVPADDPLRWGFTVNALKQGFAVVYSNSGHDAATEPGISFAFRDPVRKVDYAFRATELSALAAKSITTAFYQRESDYDYFDGCSWGGHQGFAMAQRFPDLFDGIIAGSPVFDFTSVHFNHRQVYGALYPDWPQQQDTDVLADAILAKCDTLDGVNDGVIQNPRVCEFNPVVDLPECDSSDSTAHCIAPQDRQRLASIYMPVVSDGRILSPGRPVSGEIKGYRPNPRRPGAFAIRDAWMGMLTVANPDDEPFILNRLIDAVKVFLFAPDDLERSWLDFDIDKDWQAVRTQAQLFDETNPDLGPLRASGGKLLVYHGWADYNINPNLTYEYFEEVHRVMGSRAANDTARLFMVPGMYHCRGGHDVFEFDGMTPLINWVEREEPPDQIIFSGNADFNPGRERPVCAFPKTATYRGGDSERPESFECAE